MYDEVGVVVFFAFCVVLLLAVFMGNITLEIGTLFSFVSGMRFTVATFECLHGYTCNPVLEVCVCICGCVHTHCAVPIAFALYNKDVQIKLMSALWLSASPKVCRFNANRI